MTHFDEGVLLAHLDGELDAVTGRRVASHQEACGACAARIDELRLASAELAGAAARLDPPAEVPVERARERIKARTRPERVRGTAFLAGIVTLRRAAVLVLCVAGAAAAAVTLPGSPFRDRVLTRWQDDALPSAPAPIQAGAAAVDAAPIQIAVLPVAGQLRILLEDAEVEAEVLVRLVDDAHARITLHGGAADAAFRSAPGRLQVSGVSAGRVLLELPRSAGRVTVESDGRVYLIRDGGGLRIREESVDTSVTEVYLRLGR